VHPALHSWREELPSAFVRLLAYLGGLLLLSIAAARIFQAAPATRIIAPDRSKSQWITIERPFPAFALAIPEAADEPSTYVIRRNVANGGRRDILSLGQPAGASPDLQVEIYRPGRELAGFAEPQDELRQSAEALGRVVDLRAEAPLVSKFGPLSVAAFDVTAPTLRHCLGFLRDFDDPYSPAPLPQTPAPLLQLSGRFCQGGADFIERSTLACALDRLTLLAAGSEPKIGALFAEAELRRDFCGQRNLLLAPTFKYRALWGKTAHH
jgi:hypothetical protein